MTHNILQIGSAFYLFGSVIFLVSTIVNDIPYRGYEMAGSICWVIGSAVLLVKSMDDERSPKVPPKTPHLSGYSAL